MKKHAPMNTPLPPSLSVDGRIGNDGSQSFQRLKVKQRRDEHTVSSVCS